MNIPAWVLRNYAVEVYCVNGIKENESEARWSDLTPDRTGNIDGRWKKWCSITLKKTQYTNAESSRFHKGISNTLNYMPSNIPISAQAPWLLEIIHSKPDNNCEFSSKYSSMCCITPFMWVNIYLHTTRISLFMHNLTGFQLPYC